MTPDLAKTIDHTQLKPDATRGQIAELCRQAAEHGFYSVCVNGAWVPDARALLAGTGVRVAAVTGFPLGACPSEAKAFETSRVVGAGADEIDTVINLGLLLSGDVAAFTADLKGVVAAAEGRPVKVILETCLLDRDQKILACRQAVEAGAAFVKTSTGFSSGGATVEDVRLMKETVGGACQVKASGGIRDRATALAMIAAGATRLGTSSGIAILAGQAGDSAY